MVQSFGMMFRYWWFSNHFACRSLPLGLYNKVTENFFNSTQVDNAADAETADFRNSTQIDTQIYGIVDSFFLEPSK